MFADDDLVIEFQHSAIHPNERIAREKFYKNMVWIIDGTRLKRDYPRFLKGRTDLRRTEYPGIFQVSFPDEYFPSAWVGSAAPVIFDFKGSETINDPNDPRNYIYCLLPSKDGRIALLAMLSRRDFIDSTTTGEWLSMIKSYTDKQNQSQSLQQGHRIQNFGKRRESPYIFEKGRYIKRRRF
jgi:hypothetical protein